MLHSTPMGFPWLIRVVGGVVHRCGVKSASISVGKL
jgi:hypothetical protein